MVCELLAADVRGGILRGVELLQEFLRRALRLRRLRYELPLVPARLVGVWDSHELHAALRALARGLRLRRLVIPDVNGWLLGHRCAPGVWGFTSESRRGGRISGTAPCRLSVRRGSVRVRARC